MTIGAFARSSGLTASALRFYADTGLLHPVTVDDSSGYRYYSPDQLELATTIRRLRAIDLPLDRVARFLTADADAAGRLLDTHVAGLAAHAEQARRTAAELRAALGARDPETVCETTGPALATAVEQVLTATVRHAEFPVLAGVRLEVTSGAATLTATDRYRLATRTVVVRADREWAATVAGDDLRTAMPRVRRWHRVRIVAFPDLVRFRADDDHADCHIVDAEFPDYRGMLAALPAVRTRVIVGRNALVASLDQVRDRHVRLRIADAVTVGEHELPATVTGPPSTLHFDVTTLYPAVVSAVGPDVLIDIAAPDRPVVIRSADDGDLTTLAMPVAPRQDVP